MEKYIILLKSVYDLPIFKEYLSQNEICISLEDVKTFILIVDLTEDQAAIIAALPYISAIVKDFMIETNLHLTPDTSSTLNTDTDNVPMQEDITKSEKYEKQVAILYKNWGINQIAAPCYWARNITGTGINVAVLDTGVGPHTDLIVSKNVSFVPGQTPADLNGHGTHVAGIIAARNFGNHTVGIAYNCNLFNVKVLSDDTLCSTQSIIRGLLWCANNDVAIINMSFDFGTPLPPAFFTILQAILNILDTLGIIIISASGNMGNPVVLEPASMNSVISVGATNICNKRWHLSNYGNGLDYVAPGVDICSTYLNNGYAIMSNTSIAVPQVSGLIALILSEDPSRTPTQVKRILTSNAIDLGNPGYDIEYGNGLIHVPSYPLTLIVDPSKSIFTCDGTGFVNISAYNDLGNPINNVRLDISITTPSGQTLCFVKYTNNLGKYNLEFLIDCCQYHDNSLCLPILDEEGAYIVSVYATADCYIPQAVSNTFRLAKGKLKATVDTDRCTYCGVDNGIATALVTDENNRLVSDANVIFIIKSSCHHIVAGYTTTTNSRGLAYLEFSVNCCNKVTPVALPSPLVELGEYTVDVEVSAPAYESARGHNHFEVVKDCLYARIITDHINSARDEVGSLIVAVTDKSNQVVSNAQVQIEISSPSHKKYCYDKVTDESGLVYLTILTNPGLQYNPRNVLIAAAAGDYTICVTATHEPGYCPDCRKCTVYI